MEQIAGRTAFITGGASGIGLGLGKALATRGCRVVLADIDAGALEEAACDFPGEVEIVRLDVRDRTEWTAARERAEARFGPVSILANNAGVMNEGTGSYSERTLLNQSPESFDRMIAINLTGVFNGIHEFGPGMAGRGEGHIVNTSSTQGVIACAGVGSYCASKFGVVGMSESLRQELEPFGVGVSVLCPGVVQTNLATSTNKLVGLPPVTMPEGFGLDPARVGEMVIDAIEANRFYIFTHGEYILPVVRRHARIQAELAETPISPIYKPSAPLPGTPEFADFMTTMEASGGSGR
jgi:NAD(P)-dependent dehydrogenase (short-subunit alcohol dehydrogenase family)